MTKELEEALRNIEGLCASVKLTRDEHLLIARNINMIKEALSNKKDKKNASDTDTK